MDDLRELLNFGVINIDKPAGPTSFSVSEFVKRELKLKKTSHMGTLDPKVTGVLPITLGRACKLARYLISHDKVYVGILECHKEQDIFELQKIIDEKFVGKIRQTPPHRSAVKREEREREVYRWKLLEASEDNRNFLFEASVEGGTYIRKLCSDLGELIGGAHMGELRRICAGKFSERGFGGSGVRGFGRLVKLDEFEAAVKNWRDGDGEDLRGIVVDARDVIREVLPVVEVKEDAVKSLWIGRPVFRDSCVVVPELEAGESFVVFAGDVFVGVYRRTDEEIVLGRAEFVCN